MAAKTEVPITGSVLRWAMEEAGYSNQELAERLKVDPEVVQAWQDEVERPGKTEFGKILDAVRRPSAIFFMNEPPVRAALPTAFRRAPGAQNHSLTPNALRAIRRARRLQKAVSWLYSTSGAASSAVAARPRVEWEVTNARWTGEAVRASLQLPLSGQIAWADAGAALRAWRTVLDDQGILMFTLELGRDEIRGFSAWDDFAPMIAVNSGFNPGARIFTMAHELGHLLTRTDSACFDWLSPAEGSDKRLERWCEEFAAGFLLPQAPLVAFVRAEYATTPANPVRTFDDVATIAARLKVSARAASLALIEAGLSSWAVYRSVDDAAQVVDRPPDRKGGGGARSPEKRISQYGTRAPDVLIRALDEGTLGLRDAADYLELSASDLQDLRELLRTAPGGAR